MWLILKINTKIIEEKYLSKEWNDMKMIDSEKKKVHFFFFLQWAK